jgi:MerR family transcriptional regulator, heat shock protein HspR
VNAGDLYRQCQVFYTPGKVVAQVGQHVVQHRGAQQMARDETRGVYAISVAAELTGSAVQNLRVYERHGLVEPSRTDGGTRRYSEGDLDRIRRVVALLADGLNLAGIALVLDLEDDNARLRLLTGEHTRAPQEVGR